MANNSDKTFRDLLNSGQAQILGIVSIVPMGNWNGTTTYQKLNYVRNSATGATYLAMGSNINVEPGVTANWEKSWMLCNYDGGSVNPQGTYPDMTVGKVVNALFFGSKSYDGSAQQTITAADLGISSVYTPQGSIPFASLPQTPSANELGYVWNISDSFTTDSRFLEGAGIVFAAGTNVGVIENNGNYYYDILGAIVDLSNYVTKTQVATSSSLGLIQLGYQENEKNYPVELDSNNRAYVNVPWDGTNYSAGTGLELSEQGVFSLEAPVSVANGGTGQTSLANVTVGNAETADKVANALTFINANGGTKTYNGAAAQTIDLAPTVTTAYAEIGSNTRWWVNAKIVMERRGNRANIHIDFRLDLQNGSVGASDFDLISCAKLRTALGLNSFSCDTLKTRATVENLDADIYGDSASGTGAGLVGFIIEYNSSEDYLTIARIFQPPAVGPSFGAYMLSENYYTEAAVYHVDIWDAVVS